MICAVILARNSAKTISHAVHSVSWCDAIFLFDDHSTDGTVETARAISKIPIHVEKSPYLTTAFEEGELRVRNRLLKRTELTFSPDAIVLLDADEMMNQKLLPFAREVERGHYSSVSCSIFHLFDSRRYIRYRETLKYGVYQIDPHVRIIRPGMRYVELKSDDERHPLMPPGTTPLHLHGPLHFHLKYLQKIKLENSSLEFLPRVLSEDILSDFLEPIRFQLPNKVFDTLHSLGCKLEVDDDVSSELRDLPITSAVPAITKRLSCLVVAAGGPAEALIVARLMTLLRSRTWCGDVAVICSQSASHLVVSSEQQTVEQAVAASQHGIRYDLIFQLSSDHSVVASISTIPTKVRRGLTLLPRGEIGPANLLAIGYFQALGKGGDLDRFVRLAMQACELE